MPGDYRNSLGYLGLQLRAGQLAQDQARQAQVEQQGREAAQSDVQNTLAFMKQHEAAKSASEDRKLQLAAMLQKAAEANQTRKDIQDLKDAAAKPERESKVTKNNATTKFLEAKTEDIPTDSAEKERHDRAEEITAGYNAETNRGKLPFMGPFGGMNVKLGPNGLPPNVPPVPLEAETAITDTAADLPVERPATGESPPAAAPEAPNLRVKDEPITRTGYDAAVKALEQAKVVERAFERANKGIAAAPEDMFGNRREDFRIEAPFRLPFMDHKVGIQIPGHNTIEDTLVSEGFDKSPVGRKLIQILAQGHGEEATPPEGTFTERKNLRGEAKSALQDLTSQIGLMRLGTTSTAAQDARMDKILGMAADKQFGHNKEYTAKVMRAMQNEFNKTRAEYQYMLEHKAIPLEDLPDAATPTNVDELAKARGKNVETIVPPDAVQPPKPEDIQVQPARRGAPLGNIIPVPQEPPKQFSLEQLLNNTARQYAVEDPEAGQMYEMLRAAGVDEQDALNQILEFRKQKLTPVAKGNR